MTDRTCRTCGSTIMDMVDLVMHECDEILSVPDMTSDEQETLLYVEERLVNNYGSRSPERAARAAPARPRTRGSGGHRPPGVGCG